MRLRQVLLGSAIVLGSAGAAEAAYITPTGWYLSLGAGANWISDGDIVEKETGVVDEVFSGDWDGGFIAAGAIGYDFGRNWRVEFEVAYRGNEGDGFCTSGGECVFGDTDIWELSQMVNVMYDIGLGGNWEAAVGAGIGGNLVVFSSFDDEPSVGLDDYVFAAQLIAQVAYRLSERWQLYLDYHFMVMDDPEVTQLDEVCCESFEIEKTDHSLMLGIRFDLQRDGTLPVYESRSPKQFIVFFGFNKSNLTPEAARVVADAAQAAKDYGSSQITIVGHTDTVGSPEYNLRLSLRRADAVKGGLMQNGIPGNAISTGGRGEDELMVQTGDGVKEPQNRRATIDLN